VERLALTIATDEAGLQIDLSFVMGGFTFDEVWPRRRTFMVERIPIPVARLSDIVISKAQAGRDKDRLFLATHREALEHLQRWDDATPQSGAG
jgi:hypothetical protein